MASVDLVHVWLHDAADLATAVRLSARNLQATPSRQADQRAYAAGRIRKVVGPAITRTVTWDALQVDRDTLAALDDWIGADLMLRDPRGRVFWGFLRGLEVVEQTWTERVWLPGMTFYVVTGTAEV